MAIKSVCCSLIYNVVEHIVIGNMYKWCKGVGEERASLMAIQIYNSNYVVFQSLLRYVFIEA